MGHVIVTILGILVAIIATYSLWEIEHKKSEIKK